MQESKRVRPGHILKPCGALHVTRGLAECKGRPKRRGSSGQAVFTSENIISDEIFRWLGDNVVPISRRVSLSGGFRSATRDRGVPPSKFAFTLSLIFRFGPMRADSTRESGTARIGSEIPSPTLAAASM